MAAAVKVLIVDDHPMVAEGIQSILESYDDIRVVGSLTDGREAVEQMRQLAPDVVLMDLNMPKLGGAERHRADPGAEPRHPHRDPHHA